MKKLLTVLLSAGMVLSMGFAGNSTAMAADVTAVGGTSGMVTHPSSICGNFFCDYITEKTEGRIAFDFKDSRAYGEESDLIQQAMDGTLDFCIVGTTTISNMNKCLDCWTLPFLMNSYELEEKALDMPEFNVLLDQLENQNLRVLGIIECGMFSIANNVKPITCVEDLAGMKIRSLTSDSATRTFTNLGANPIPIAYGEIYTSLQNGIIDGTETNWSSVSAEKFYEQLKYYTEIGVCPYSMNICINLDFWNKLSEEDQAIFREAALEASHYSFEVTKGIDVSAREDCEALGLEVNEITDVSEFAALQTDLYDEAKASDPLVKAFVEAIEAMK